jgi:hypothetical protein
MRVVFRYVDEVPACRTMGAGRALLSRFRRHVGPSRLHRIEALRSRVDNGVVPVGDVPTPRAPSQDERQAIVTLQTEDSIRRSEMGQPSTGALLSRRLEQSA